tara:strand:- start:207 stop:764 length:558 start_codon:yes stop_codon:yes gene_type:complete
MGTQIKANQKVVVAFKRKDTAPRGSIGHKKVFWNNSPPKSDYIGTRYMELYETEFSYDHSNLFFLEDNTTQFIRLLKWFKDSRNYISRAGNGMLCNEFVCVLKMKIANHRGWLRSLPIRAVAPPLLIKPTNSEFKTELVYLLWNKWFNNLFSLLPSTTLLFWAFHRVSTLSLTKAIMGSSGYEKQ